MIYQIRFSALLLSRCLDIVINQTGSCAWRHLSRCRQNDNGMSDSDGKISIWRDEKLIEVGDKIKIIKAQRGAYGANGRCGYVIDKPDKKPSGYNGLSYDKSGLFVKLEDGSTWNVGIEIQYEILQKRDSKMSGNTYYELIERLKAYEDTGLEPKDVTTAKSLAIQYLRQTIAENDRSVKLGRRYEIDVTCICEANKDLEKVLLKLAAGYHENLTFNRGGR